MCGHNHKLETANVVAVFETQDDADEAVLGLRLAGFRDNRIGYFARNLAGQVTDFVGKMNTIPGAVIGMLLGAGLGIGLGQLVLTGQDTPLAPPLVPEFNNVLLTCALWGAVALGIVGAALGYMTPRGETVHYGDEMAAGRYVIAVNAGDRTGEAWDAIRRHGGHDPEPADGVMRGAVAV
jgi:hypothetical protein